MNALALAASAPDADWLADMAGVWVERWLAHGGWLQIDPGCDHVSTGMHFRRSAWRTRQPFGNRQWVDGWKVGRWRELHEMSEYVPGLREAIVHHIALNGTLEPSGSIMMYRTAAEMGAA